MFIEEGQSVFFPKVGLCLHKSFSDKFKNLTFPQARRKLQKSFTHSQQDHIMHYLKNKEITRSGMFPKTIIFYVGFYWN